MNHMRHAGMPSMYKQRFFRPFRIRRCCSLAGKLCQARIWFRRSLKRKYFLYNKLNFLKIQALSSSPSLLSTRLSLTWPNAGGQAIKVQAADFPSLLQMQELQSCLKGLPGSHLRLSSAIESPCLTELSYLITIKNLPLRGRGGQAILVQAAFFPSLLQVQVLQSCLKTFPGSQLNSELLLSRHAMSVHAADLPSLLHLQVLQSSLNTFPGSQESLEVKLTALLVVSRFSRWPSQAIRVQTASLPSWPQMQVLQSRLNVVPGSHCCSTSASGWKLLVIVFVRVICSFF